MLPNLTPNEKALISSLPFFFKSPSIGDIVAFREDDKIFVKRIKFIKEDKFFLEGDNNKDSLDSRSFGFIFKKQILGKLIFKF